MAKTKDKKKKTANEGRMTIWEHLGELRRRLTVIVVAILVATGVLYFFSPELIFFLTRPVADRIAGEPVESMEQLTAALNILDLMGGFILRFQVSLFFGAIVTSPIWIWQIMAFFLPALKPNERKWVLPTFFVGVFLFAFGLTFCYLVILDPAFAWLLEQTTDFANIVADASRFIPSILFFEIAFGLAFQLPLIVFYLIVFNIVPYDKLRKSWRVVYVVLLVFCAVVTPDASPVTMVLMFVAIAVLYEASLFISRIVLNKRIKELAKRDAGEEDGIIEEDA